MLLSQIRLPEGGVGVVADLGDGPHLVRDAESSIALAHEAIADGSTLASVVKAHGVGDAIDLVQVYADGRFLPPITHADPSHVHLTGTGLTHLGSASARDAMHTGNVAEMTDSMKMFNMGIENGKPAPGETGVQPEWFYKGNGHTAVAAGADLVSPAFALDGGEEPELAGIYLIGPDGGVHRVGWALANEFSDHVTEKQNYLYLAHSKLRQAAFGQHGAHITAAGLQHATNFGNGAQQDVFIAMVDHVPAEHVVKGMILERQRIHAGQNCFHATGLVDLCQPAGCGIQRDHVKALGC